MSPSYSARDTATFGQRILFYVAIHLLFHRYDGLSGVCNSSSQSVHVVSLFSQLYTFCFTLKNLWRFRGLVCIPLLPVVAYLAFACSFGYGFLPEFVEDTRGKEVVLVRRQCSTTSLKSTSHGPFFPPMLFWPGCRTSLKEVFAKRIGVEGKPTKTYVWVFGVSS